MREYNYNLALLALVCRCYDRTREAHVLLKDAADPHNMKLELSPTEITSLLNAAGVPCVAWVAPPREVPPAIQAMADRGHVVLVQFPANIGPAYASWGVLEVSMPTEQRVLTLWHDDSTKRYPRPLVAYASGSLVVTRHALPIINR